MSPSGRLCLLTIVGLIMPTRDAAPVWSTPPTSTWPADVTQTETPGHLTEIPQQVGHTPELETETKSQQPMGTDAFFLMTDPGPRASSKEATHSARPTERTTVLYHRPTPDRHFWMNDNYTPRPPGADEDSPFFYDEATLRRRGLLVAAVLFITGIVILTSGKCRQLSQLCRKRGRAYSVVNTGSHEREDTAGCSQS